MQSITSFYIKVLRILEFWYLRGLETESPCVSRDDCINFANTAVFKRFNCGKSYNMKVTILFLRVQFLTVKYIYLVVQLISRTLHFAKLKLYTFNNCPFQPSPSSWQSPFTFNIAISLCIY